MTYIGVGSVVPIIATANVPVRAANARPPLRGAMLEVNQCAPRRLPGVRRVTIPAGTVVSRFRDTLEVTPCTLGASSNRGEIHPGREEDSWRATSTRSR